MAIEAKIVGVGRNILGNKRQRLWTLIVLVFIVFTLFTSIRIIGTGRLGVVTQFGKVTERELSEGLSIDRKSVV